MAEGGGFTAKVEVAVAPAADTDNIKRTQDISRVCWDILKSCANSKSSAGIAIYLHPAAGIVN